MASHFFKDFHFIYLLFPIILLRPDPCEGSLTKEEWQGLPEEALCEDGPFF